MNVKICPMLVAHAAPFTPPVKNKDKYRIKDNVCDAAYQHTTHTILLGLPSARMIPASLSSLSAFARA